MHLTAAPRALWRALLAHRALFLLLFLGVFLPLRVFWEVAEDVYRSGGFASDRAILHALHQGNTPTLDVLMLTLSRIGGPTLMPIVGLVIAAILWFRRRHADALFFAIALVGSSLLNLAIKAFVERPRPDLWKVIAPEGGYSFPSGHAMTSAALAAALCVLAWPTRGRWPVAVLATLFSLGVGVSRMYIGVHYPSDVLAGWVGGVAWVTGVHLLFSWRAGGLRRHYSLVAGKAHPEAEGRAGHAP